MKKYIVKQSEYKPLEGKEIALQPIVDGTITGEGEKGNGGVDVKKPSKSPKAPGWFQAFQTTNTTLLEEILKRLSRVEIDVSGLKTDVSELKIDVAGLKTDVSSLKTDVSGLKTDVAGLKTDVSGLKTDMSKLDSKLTNVITLNNLRS